jgi:hypothetical protein
MIEGVEKAVKENNGSLGPSSPKNDEQRVLSLLDSEIEHIRDAQTRQGWTSWGLIGGIIGCLWLLSEEFKVGQLRLEFVAIAVLIFSTFVDSLKWLAYLVRQGLGSKTEQVTFRWSNELFSGSELSFVLEILRSLALLIVAFFLVTRRWLPLSTLTFAYVWYVFLATSWLILARSEFAIRQDLTKKGAVFILVFAIPAFLSFLSYLWMAPVPTTEVVSSYRAGGVFTAISYLIVLLAIITKDSPILQSLLQIRRNIVFNRVELDSAASQVEIALGGMQVPDAIQKDVHPILTLVDKLNEATNSLIYQVETMRTHLPSSNDSADVVLAKLRILTTHRSTCEFILKGRNSTFQELDSKYQQLMRRRQRIQAVIPEASDFFNKLDSGMKTILDEADRRFADYVDKANAYDKALGEIKIP